MAIKLLNYILMCFFIGRSRDLAAFRAQNQPQQQVLAPGPGITICIC